MNTVQSHARSTSLATSELDYDLPEHLIATRPAEPRDSARLLVISRSHDRIEHRTVRDLPCYLNAGDALVFNTTAVLPARLIGRRLDTGGRVEGLYLHDEHSPAGTLHWQVMLKAGGRLKPGVRIEWYEAGDHPSGIVSELIECQEGEWHIDTRTANSTIEILTSIGRTPLPPYILHARAERSGARLAVEDAQDRQWYQTVYAAGDQRHSVAAPTAGLHFTADLLQAVSVRGVKRIDVTLHVGPGTFKPVTAPTLSEHRMHAEAYTVTAEAISALRAVRQSQPPGRVIAVGTTTVRTLESLPYPMPEKCGSIAGMTDLMIAPPYDFRFIDGLMTNFHLPRSTLLALVGAMVGLDRLKSVYQEAIRSGYRFYSYGDAMLILP